MVLPHRSSKRWIVSILFVVGFYLSLTAKLHHELLGTLKSSNNEMEEALEQIIADTEKTSNKEIKKVKEELDLFMSSNPSLPSSTSMSALSTQATTICDQPKNKLWTLLCDGNFDKVVTDLLGRGIDISIVQIGAHTGFEPNDPLSQPLTSMFQELNATKMVHWTWVEPSPTNHVRLVMNLNEHSNVCDMKSVNAAIISDATSDTDAKSMTFYSVRDTIDPETGMDSLSGKQLPHYVTQLSSFSKDPILFNKRVFSRQGLNVEDYIVEVQVEVKRYSELMEEVVVNEKTASSKKESELVLVLIDTEGFDCKIVNGISDTSLYWPKYLIFEHKSCGRSALTESYQKLGRIGYKVTEINRENTLAIKK